jgi:hypothetical protein
MAIRRFHYQIDYVHILTFKEQYKDIVTPYFPFENVEYAVENENTIHEGIRLIFKSENIVISLNKQSIVIIFEGDLMELKNQNGPIKIFWDIYERIKNFKNYTRTARHTILAHSVVIKTEEEINSMLENNHYLNKNPFGKLDEFLCAYEFHENDINYKFQFGNYTDKDIRKQDLMPFKTDFNKDLIGNVGIMGRIETSEKEKNPSFNKFKSLLSKTEQVLSKFDL